MASRHGYFRGCRWTDPHSPRRGRYRHPGARHQRTQGTLTRAQRPGESLQPAVARRRPRLFGLNLSRMLSGPARLFNESRDGMVDAGRCRSFRGRLGLFNEAAAGLHQTHPLPHHYHHRRHAGYLRCLYCRDLQKPAVAPPRYVTTSPPYCTRFSNKNSQFLRCYCEDAASLKQTLLRLAVPL